jgi:hypothetical protein
MGVGRPVARRVLGPRATEVLMDDQAQTARGRLRRALEAVAQSQRALLEALDRLDAALERTDEAHRRMVAAGARPLGGLWRWN